VSSHMMATIETKAKFSGICTHLNSWLDRRIFNQVGLDAGPPLQDEDFKSVNRTLSIIFIDNVAGEVPSFYLTLTGPQIAISSAGVLRT
jgi:hypothetical protein